MEERLTAAGGELLATVRAGVATVTLNRPAQLNALSYGMLEELSRWLAAWREDPRVRVVLLRGAGDKAFCAGGDVRAVRDSILAGGSEHLRYFPLEYTLDYRIHTYPKPVVALMDGIVMGGGMGLAQGASLRIVGDRTRMAMPETIIGLFPDVGASYFLSRLPGRIGLYLALVGPTIRAADAIEVGLADAYLAPEAIEGLLPALEQAARATDPGAAVRAVTPAHEPGMLPGGELAALRPAIDRHFGQGSVREIVRSLRGERDARWRDWAARTVEALEKRSPTALEVTFEAQQCGAVQSLADTFRMELNLVHGCFEQGDFVEGTRAMLVDKDNRPRWNPPTLDAVDPASVERFFARRWSLAGHPLACLSDPHEDLP